jgi:hypothetical protein
MCKKEKLWLCYNNIFYNRAKTFNFCLIAIARYYQILSICVILKIFPVKFFFDICFQAFRVMNGDFVDQS